jgi:deoxyribonuclease V
VVKIAVDVHYHDGGGARAAAVVFADWASPTSVREVTVDVEVVAPYAPGSFYERELPCALAVLAQAGVATGDIVVVDAYVDLGPRPGLGRHLWRALAEQGVDVACVGVAKTRYQAAGGVALTRGESASPLFISAVGMTEDAAAEAVARMHGPYRVPTMLRRVDALARGL